MRFLIFLAIVVVLTVLWQWYKRSKLPKNFKDACVCGHRKITHISYAGKCDYKGCDCSHFLLSKKKVASNYYFMREEGPTAKVIRFCAASFAMILVAILPRHILLNWALRIRAWLDREEKKAEQEIEEKEDE